MPSQYVIALDPGGTTGIAVRYPDGSCGTTTTNTQEDLWLWFLEEEMGKLPDHVVMEEWVYFDNIVKPAGLYTASLVSGVTAICWLLDIPLSLRTPSSRKDQLTNAKIWLNKNKPQHVIHEVDALAHLLKWEYERERGIRFPSQRRTRSTDPSQRAPIRTAGKQGRSQTAKPWLGSRRSTPR